MDALGIGGLNNAFNTVSGAIASAGQGTWSVPGLLAPEAMTTTFSGMTVNIGLPSPWGIVTSGGVVVHPHGTQTGQDTQNYSVNFAPLVPASGSITAYLVASVQTIQQNPFPIPGPPPGFPTYNPNFVPTVAYASSVYTINLTASTGGFDNYNTFEVFRTTLSAGQASLSSGAITTLAQQRAGERKATPFAAAPAGVLTVGQLQYVVTPFADNLTTTLPPTSGANGLTFVGLNNRATNWTIATLGTDRIAGYNNNTIASSIVLAPNASVTLVANPYYGVWAALDALPYATVQQGGGTSQLTNKVYLGWDGTAPRIQIDVTDEGRIGMLGTTQTWTQPNTFSSNVTVNGTLTGVNENLSGTLSGVNAIFSGLLETYGVTYFGNPASYQFYANPNSGGNQLLNFASNQYIEFVPGQGLFLNTTGNMSLGAGTVVTSSNFQVNGSETILGNSTIGQPSAQRTLTVYGNLNVGGAGNGNITGTAVNSNGGNSVAVGGYVRASYGSRNPKPGDSNNPNRDGNMCPIMADFTTGNANGGTYWVFPNGTIIQFGQASANRAGSQSENGWPTWWFQGVTLNLPMAFPSTLTAAFGSGQDQGGHLVFNAAVQGFSNSQLTIFSHVTSDFASTPFWWLAVGN